MKTLLAVHWYKKFEDEIHDIGFDMETGEFIYAWDMEEGKKYYGIDFMAIDSCTEYMREVAGLDYFIEYPDIVQKEITRQTNYPTITTKDDKIIPNFTIDWREPDSGQFIIVMEYHSWKDEWTFEYNESVDLIGILGVDCEIKPKQR